MSKKILEKYSLKEAEQKVKTKRDFENQAIDLLKKLREFLDDNPHVPKEDKQIFGSVLKKIAGYTVIEDIEEVSEEVKIEKDTYEDLTPKDIKNISNNNEDKSLTITETYSKDEVLALISAKKKGYIVEGFVKKDQLMGKASLSFNKNTYITEGRMTKEQQQMFPKVFTIRYYKDDSYRKVSYALEEVVNNPKEEDEFYNSLNREAYLKMEVKLPNGTIIEF